MTTRELRGVLLCLVLTAGHASAASAQSRERGEGFEAGLRTGYGIPLGKAADPDGDLSEGVSGKVPIWIDLGYRALPELFVGLYAQYGFGFVGSSLEAACDSPGVDCSTSIVRLGAQLHYHPAPRGSVDPWIGLGFGYEWATWGTEAGGAEVSFSSRGFELLNLQLGLDVPVATNFYIGPAVSFSLGQYDSLAVDCSGVADCSTLSDVDGDIPDKALHEWLVLGVRATYAP